MSHAEWKDVVVTAVGLINRQPTPFQIFTWLGIAFVAVLVIEGFRVNFFPARRAYAVPTVARAAAQGMLQDRPAQRKFQVRVGKTHNAKKSVVATRRQSPPKPQIRRIPSLANRMAPVVTTREYADSPQTESPRLS
jgi:hypothetical protein